MKKALLIGVSALAIAAAVTAPWLMALAADPVHDKDCGSVLPVIPVARWIPLPVFVPMPPEPRWAQRGGAVNDASCLSHTQVAGVVNAATEEDVVKALAYARFIGLSVSAAGVRHSMGGQAFRRGGMVLDMRAMNAIKLDARARTVTVGAGATWHDIQNAIHPRFAVKSMQSTDIFSVGGSISVNAHGMDHQAGALMESIRRPARDARRRARRHPLRARWSPSSSAMSSVDTGCSA
ncbi:MAG: FAD-dependent oxidoreductase [Sphingomonas sp.]